MAQTTLSGPIQSGDRPAGYPGGPNIGQVFLSQTFLINRDATLVQSNSIILPVNSQIVEIYADTLTPYDSATSATLTVGSAAAGTQYVTSVNAKTGGRNTTAHTAAQCTAMANIGTNTSVFGTVTSVGQPTVGQVRVTVQYVQTQSSTD
jgi:hypothetical protein